MKAHRLFRQTAAVVLELVFLVQSFGVVPVLAADSYQYSLNYNEGYYLSNDEDFPQNHPIIIPDPDEEDGAQFHIYDEIGTVGEAIPDWGPDPYRVIGYTFDGWWNKDISERNGQQITADTLITEDILNNNILYLYGHWTEYASPDITSGSLAISARNASKELIGDVSIPDFSSDVTEYTAEVYGDTQYLTLGFEQYEPEGETTVTFNGEEIALDDEKKEEITTDNAYVIDKADGSTLHQITAVTGIKLGTEDDAISLNDGDNIIEITVTLPGGESKTYTINVIRLKRQLRPNYGNSPYGEILGNEFTSEEAKKSEIDTFNANYTYNNVTSRIYSKKAWDLNGTRTTELLKGHSLGADDYINYDKDDTAIFVYAGAKFTEPGVTLYGENGTEISLSSENSVTRTIHYSEGDITEQLIGTDGENIIELPQDIKYGRYIIDYTYNYDGGTISSSRNMFVLPKPGDINMDGYVNSLDTLEYLKTPLFDTDADCLYYYRSFDTNRDGVVNSVDQNRAKAHTPAQVFYTDLSIEESVETNVYSPSGEKTELSMVYMGVGDEPAEAPDESYQIKSGDTFWVGYKLSGTDKAEAFEKSIYSMTFAVDYDSRYIAPAQNWTDKVTEYFSGYELSSYTSSGRDYTVDSSTASHTWGTTNPGKDIKTAVLDLYANEAGKTFADGDYIFVIPFTVNNVPPEGRSVISTHLDANNLNISFGKNGAEYRAMWDTSDKLNSSTVNLMSIIDYMGDCELQFEEEEIIDLTEQQHLIYGDSVTITNKAQFNSGLLEGELPPGLSYSPNTNLISGYPEKTGEFVFRIGGKKFSITVDKAELRVIADNKEKTYGEENPELTFKYEGFKFEDGKDETSIDRVIKSEPVLSCSADTTTECTDDDNTVPVVFDKSSGESDFYSFAYTDAALTITPKPITVNITNIPVCTSAMVHNNSLTISAAAVNGDGFTSNDIINEDKVKISYDVTYIDTTAGSGKRVSISKPEFVMETGFEGGKNYTVEFWNSTSNEGTVSLEVISEIRIRENLKTEYTYGETIDLSTGSLIIRYDSEREETVTFAQAQTMGIRIRYNDDTLNEVKSTDIMRVKGYGSLQGHDGIQLILDVADNDDVRSKVTSALHISKKELHIIADNKERYYGDDNSKCHASGSASPMGFTYHFNDSDFVNGDTSTSSSFTGFEEPVFSCAADAATEVDKTAGYTEVPIVLSGGSADNYEIICENAVLTINKRPIMISEITSGVPALTAEYYSAKNTLNVPAYAVAGTVGEGETVSMEVNNLYNNDPIRITYNAKYANSAPTSNINITVADANLDNDYGKSYNYTLQDYVKTAAGGRVYPRNITAMSLTEQPELEYTYGEPLDLATGNIHIVYDSTEEYDVTLQEAVNSHNVTLTYTDTNTAAENGDHLIVNDTGRTITITSPQTIYDVDTLETEELAVNRFVMSVSADNIYTVYGEELPVYTYTYEKSFPYGETENDFNEKPSFVCKEDNGSTDVNQRTPAGVYTIQISGAEADNYSFEYTVGKCTVRQKPLIVTKIDNIEALSSADAYYEKNLSKEYDIKTDEDSSALTFAENYAPLWDDFVEIKYTVTYPDPSAVGSADVDISGGELVRNYGSARNYYLQYINTPQKGSIDKALITNIEITADPALQNGAVRKYSYGDALDLSEQSFSLEITFDSGRVDSNVTFDKLEDYGITAEFSGTDDKVKDNSEFLTIDYHNEKKIVLTPPSDAVLQTPAETRELSVGKREMHVIVNPASYTYGDGPDSGTYTLSYETNDFAPGESALTAFGSPFTAPVLKCEVDGRTADEKTGAGTYENAVTAEGGESHNYEFVCDSTNKLTVNKRALKIERITGGIPDLTAKDVYEHGEQFPIKLTGYADNFSNKNLLTGNVVNEDEIEITYQAVYSRGEQSEQEPVGIESVEFTDSCESSKNYYIESAPSDSTGKILTRLISEIVVRESPSKMKYTYGEWFRLEGGAVDIVYNSGYVDEGITFDNLKNFGIDITFVKQDINGNEIVGSEVKPNTLLTVPEHHGARIKLTVAENPDRDVAVEGIQPAYSDELVVNKHIMRIIGEDAAMTYGDSAPAAPYSWHYNVSDLVNGDSLTSSRFAENLTDPVVGCSANSATPAGKYNITPSGGRSDNYIFDYVPGTLTINKKELKITAITDGIPELTSEIIYLNGSTPPIYLSGEAEYTASKKQMTLEGLINDDEIGIVYTAVYNTIEVSKDDTIKQVTVGIDSDSVKFDKTHAGNDSYVIVEVPSDANGGVVFKEQITKVEILEDPILRSDNNQPIQYTYGDELVLNRGLVRIEYNSNRSQELRFDELIEKTEGLVIPVYNDGTDERVAYNGDILHASYHNGKRIKLKVDTAVQLTEPQTAMLNVEKADITVTADNQTRAYGDANPELTFIYSGFVNGDDEDSDNFKLDLNAPQTVCEAVEKSPIGVYDISFTEGSSANYTFTTIPAKLTVEKRELDIEDITGGIPELTSKIIRDNPDAEEIVLPGAAVNTAGQLRLGNLSSGDAIRVTYNARYTSTDDERNATVEISDLFIDEAYGSGSNYKLGKVPDKSTCGNIYGKQISMVEITKQPKLEYIYGETLDLSEKGVRISYDDGEVVSNVAFDELSKYGVEISYTDNYGNETAAVSGEKLTVKGHNGIILKLHPITTLNNIADTASKPVTVSKKPLEVNIVSVTSVYGNDPTAGFKYALQGFAYGETEESDEFKNNFTAPEFICMDHSGTAQVSKTTGIGSYTIEMKGAESDNYRFIYNSGLLKITKRLLKITNITDGIPALTSDIIFENPGTAHKLAAAAKNNQLQLENLVNNDEITIAYNAVYNIETPSEYCNVNIEYISIDNENYEIDSESVKTVGGGKIYDKEITSVEITEQPKLEYTYGDAFNLSAIGGKVKITYDSGFVENNISFADLANHRITLTYTDDSGASKYVVDGEKLTVPNHNGKRIKLTARSAYEVTPTLTDDITVNKRLLEFGEVTVNSIVYNGAVKTTTGVISFVNPQNGDNVTASADFEFEDALAGTNKTVYIRNITLDGSFSDNYELPLQMLTASGTIERAVLVPSFEGGTVELSDSTNAITVNAPAMTPEQEKGGARYEYSADGGTTWQESNVFENLGMGNDCEICIRFAQTDNYNQSEMTEAVKIRTYPVKLTFVTQGEETELKSFYTYTERVEDENAFRELIGDVGVTYYNCYYDAEGKNKLTYPLTLSGDMKIYASLKRSSSSYGGGSANAGKIPTPSPTPSLTPDTVQTPSPQSTAVPRPTPEVTAKPKNEPYITGYSGEVNPSGSMTRAEVTKIISVISGGFDNDELYRNDYYDSDDRLWHYNYIGYASYNGWVKGYLDGYFYPEKTITRGEFAAVIARYLQAEPVEGVKFRDTPETSWSTGYITSLADIGILKGYLDGCFYPENEITRAEGITLVNRVINRIPDKEAIDKLECPFTDLDKSHWAYYEIMAAACEY